MPSHPRESQFTVMTADQHLVDGLTKHAATLPTLMVGGTVYKTSEIIVVLQARIAAIRSAMVAKSVYMAHVAAARAELAKTAQLVSLARQMVHVAFGGHPDVLGDFGLAPYKVPAPRTPEAKRAAAEKRRATLAARGPAGS